MNNKFILLTNVAIPSGVAGGLFAYITGNFKPLLIVMLVFCFFDCMTKIAVDMQERGELKFNFSLVGKILVQKLFYFIVITVAIGLDYTIYHSTSYLNGVVHWKAYFGMVCIAILIATEGLDILINLEKFDVKIPFLKTGLKLFKDKIQGDKKGS